MKKRYLTYFIIILFIFSTGCKNNKQPGGNYVPGDKILDEWLVNDPISAILDDIYGLDNELTSGSIIHINKYFDPITETLTYETTYDNSGGKQQFLNNLENLLNLKMIKSDDNNYAGSFEQFSAKVRFLENDKVELKIEIHPVNSSTIFPFIDNEYPDKVIPDFPESLNVFISVRGIEYQRDDNILRFHRSWRISNESATEAIKYYEDVFKETVEKNNNTGVHTVVYKFDEQISIIVTSENIGNGMADVFVTIQYLLNEATDTEGN